jgi:5'-3' exonuclease
MRYGALLLDAHNLLHRAAHTASVVLIDLPGGGGQVFQNMDVGGAYQFVRMVTRAAEDHLAARGFLCVCWEGGPRKIRRELWPHYQAKRPEPSESFQLQERVAREVLSRVGVSQARSAGWEADDTIGTLCTKLAARGTTVGICSSDHDLHQLVSDRVHVLDPNLRGGIWDLDAVRAKWGIEPDRIPEVKALAGDSSDGIPGATGIGEKIARGLMTALPLPVLLARVRAHIEGEHTTQGLEIEGAEGSTRLSWKKCVQLAGERGQVELFHRLCAINRDAPIEFLRRYTDSPATVFKRFRFAAMLSPSSLAVVERIVGR